MQLSIREWQPDDIEKIVDYFVQADGDFLKGMGADKNNLPKREAWIQKLRSEIKKSNQEKGTYYIIWIIDNIAIGHSNINQIEFGKSAVMHLHIWNKEHRKSGRGLEFLKMTIPFYFKNFELEELICEPYAENIGPNKVLKKLGFELLRTYRTKPGLINFHQTVNRYVLTREQFNKKYN